MPPPPPPSASYSLVIVDSSDEEAETEDAYFRNYNPRLMQAEANATVQHVDGYLPSAEAETDTADVAAAAADDDFIPWAEVLPPGQAGSSYNYQTIEAASVTALPPVAASSDRPRRKNVGSYRDGPAIARKFPTEKKVELKVEKQVNTSTEGEIIRADAEIIDAQPYRDSPDEVAMDAEEVDTSMEGEIIDQPPKEEVDTSIEGEIISADSETKIIGDQPPAKKKKRKKKKKKKKKKKPAEAEAERGEGVMEVVEEGEANNKVLEKKHSIKEEMTEETISVEDILVIGTQTSDDILLDAKPKAAPNAKPKAASSKLITFGTVSVREYARTLGTHVVPADGGWPLGLSRKIVAQHPNNEANATGKGDPPSPLSPRRRSRSRSNSVLSAADRCPNSWSIDDFESRRQIELRQRYTLLVKEQRRRKYEKEWEKKHHVHKHNHHNTRSRNRGRSRSGSFSRSSTSAGGGGVGGRRNSGSFNMKMEKTPEERKELEDILAEPVALPEGELETRPYDYKKRVLEGERLKVFKRQASVGNSNNDAEQQEEVTEEEELYHMHGGRNPMFMTTKEDERRKVLLRDNHLVNMKNCKSMNNAFCKQSSCKSSNADGSVSPEPPLDPTDNATTQHIQHDLETLRIQRADPANLGCACRKLHVFLPGGKDKSHSKRKGSHRRLPERRVREELRKRGLLNKGNECMGRDKMEKLLHDAIEKEPCCWGNDCPCVRSGIECQADTCSCWHASHDVEKASTNHEGGQNVASMKARCGNENGMYVVDLEGIARHRKKYVGATECFFA